MLTRCGIAYGFGAAMLIAAPAWAEGDAATRAAARRLAQDGVAALSEGKVTQAQEQLEKAYAVLQVPSIALWSARALVARGLLVEASERYLEVSRLTIQGERAVQERAQREAVSELAALSPRIGSLLIFIKRSPPCHSVQVTLDSQVIPAALLGEPRPVNPGEHHIVAVCDEERLERTVAMAEADSKRVELEFHARSDGAGAIGGATVEGEPGEPRRRDEGADSNEAKRTVAYVALASGAAGLVLGGVTGAMALSQRRQLDQSASCRDGRCLESQRGDAEKLETLRNVSTVSFIAGAALAAGGAVLHFTLGSSKARGTGQASYAVEVGPGALRFAGRF